jgi:hypothetical protein
VSVDEFECDEIGRGLVVEVAHSMVKNQSVKLGGAKLKA